MPSTAEFLKHVLPSENHGYYVATVVRKNGPKYNSFFKTIEGLARFVLSEDEHPDKVLYHACASYKENRHDPRGTPHADRVLGRTAHNVHSVRSLWLDVDAREGKPYADQIVAAEAVQEFCRLAALPPPLYVSSGYGLYLHWPLDHDLDPVAWKSYSMGLKSACHRLGLAADPTRTADIASILRAPGTHNRKFGCSVEVFCGPLVGPYPIEAFKGLLNEAPKEAKTSSGKAGRLAIALGNTFDGDPAYSGPIADTCGQIQAFRNLRGNLSEPRWFAALGVLAFSVDGVQHAHDWSSGYDGYTYAETQERLDRCKTLTGATTCEKFHSLDPKTCEACPHWGKIKSPISLGRQRDGGLGQIQSSPRTATNPFGEKIEVQEAEQVSDELPRLPHDFFWSGERLVTRTAATRGDVDIVVSTYPIYLASVQTGEVRGEWTLIFRQKLPRRGWFDITLAARQLFSSTAAGDLAERGANIHDHAHFIRYVRAAMDQFYGVSALTVRYDQFGWKDGDKAFLYGLDLYTAEGIERVTGNDELQTRCKESWVGPAQGGELEVWKQTINALFAVGCEPQSVALLAAFAAPLMRFQERDEGGAIIHLVTRESGTGKSTALIGAASVWGRREGLGLTHDDTKVSKALTLGALGNLPVIYDEVAIRDPEAIRAFVVNFTNGRDKMRATRMGEIRHTASTWQTLLISAANTSLVDVLSQQNLPEAPAYRIMEFRLEVPEGLRHTQGDKLRRALRAHSGLAGQVFLTWLLQPANLAWTRATLERVTQQTWERTRLGPEHRFWVRTIAAIAVAGVIVRQLGLVEFSVERIMEWLFDQVGTRPKTESATWATDSLAEFLNRHRDATLVVPGPFVPGQRSVRALLEPRQRLIIRYEVSTHRYLVACSALREWLIPREQSYQEMVTSLERQGVVTARKRQATLGAGTDIPGGQVWCVEVNGAHEAVSGIAPGIKENVVSMAR